MPDVTDRLRSLKIAVTSEEKQAIRALAVKLGCRPSILISQGAYLCAGLHSCPVTFGQRSPSFWAWTGEVFLPLFTAETNEGRTSLVEPPTGRAEESMTVRLPLRNLVVLRHCLGRESCQSGTMLIVRCIGGVLNGVIPQPYEELGGRLYPVRPVRAA